MAAKKPAAAGAGRKSNSEPRIQVFKEFGGCNFELSPRDFTLGKIVDQEQSDLQMNYVVVQNNICVASNKTLETRNNLVTLCTAPGVGFSGPCVLIGKYLFASDTDGKLFKIDITTQAKTQITIENLNQSGNNIALYEWQALAYADNKLIGATEDGSLWTCDLSANILKMSNAKEVPDPQSCGTLTGHGLTISSTYSEQTPYRFSVAMAYINKFGPTAHSPIDSYYADYPVEEWHAGRFVSIAVDVPDYNYNIKAVEFYYTEGNSSSLLFAGRLDVSAPGSYTFDWFGYLDATSMWPVANLTAPEQNFTTGAHAKKIACIDSRMYFWGDPNQPQRLYIGGNSGNLFSVSPGTGGGFVDVEPGRGQDVRVVTKYKTQQGNSIVTMLCNSQNMSLEQRFNLVENSVSLSNEQSMKSWQAEQVAGAVGCKSYNGAVVCEDGLYSISRYGLALTTMTMEYNSQIQTNYVSDAIKPVFTDKNRSLLQNASIIECDGVIYMAFGTTNGTLDNILFCYDIALKAWWTITLDTNNEDIINLIHIDYEGAREGIGIVTNSNLYLLPLTKNDSPSTSATFQVTLQTGELSTQQPMQNWSYVSQLEFRFDYFLGSVTVELTGIDQFGRKVTTKKTISHNSTEYNLAEYMRVDLRLQSYQIRITGMARFRMSHFMAKVYPMSSKLGIVWGFDDSQTHRSDGDIHPTFKDYNDIRKAIIP